MLRESPPLLYHYYREVNGHVKFIFTSNKIFFSSPIKFNDKSEFTFNFSILPTGENSRLTSSFVSKCLVLALKNTEGAKQLYLDILKSLYNIGWITKTRKTALEFMIADQNIIVISKIAKILLFKYIERINCDSETKEGLEFLLNTNIYTEFINKIKETPADDISRSIDMYVNQLCQTNPEIGRELRKALLSNIGTFCLTEAWDNASMWAQYSNKHKGFCLCFNITDDPFFRMLRKVTYTSSCPSVSLLDRLIRSDYFIDATSCTKRIDWAHEKEWRIINKPGKQDFPPESLSGVIFGCDMVEEDKTRIYEWVKDGKSKPEFYTAKVKEDEYGMDLIRQA